MNLQRNALFQIA